MTTEVQKAQRARVSAEVAHVRRLLLGLRHIPPSLALRKLAAVRRVLERRRRP